MIACQSLSRLLYGMRVKLSEICRFMVDITDIFVINLSQKERFGGEMSTLVSRMKVYREKYSMSQKELAERVGVRRETIVRLESGQYNPSLRLAMDISKEFQVPVEEMFSFEEDPE